MNYIDTLVSWFIDARRTLPQRALVVICVLIGIYMVNDVLGFSYFYRMNRKAELIEKFSKIITDPNSDSTGRAHAMRLRERVVQRQPSSFTLGTFLRRFLRWGERGQRNTITPPITVNTTNIAANASIRNEFLFFLSASGIIAVVGLIMIPVAIFDKKGSSSIQRLAGIVLILLTFSGLSYLLYTLMSLIPMLFDSWSFNYVLNAVLQIGIISFVIFLLRKLSTS